MAGVNRQPKLNGLAAFMNSAKVVAAVLAVSAVGCAVFTWLTYADAAAMRDNGVETTAEVVRIRDSYAVLRFQLQNGQEVTTQVGNYRFNPTPRVGAKQSVA